MYDLIYMFLIDIIMFICFIVRVNSIIRLIERLDLVINMDKFNRFFIVKDIEGS